MIYFIIIMGIYFWSLNSLKSKPTNDDWKIKKKND